METGGLSDRVRSEVNGLFESQRDRLSSFLDGLAEALTQTSHNVNRDRVGNLADYLGSGAAATRRAAGYIHNSDLSRLQMDASGLARRYPRAFFGSTLLGGFLLARFLKASGK